MEMNSLKGDHQRIIPVLFGDNAPSGLGGDVVKRKLLNDDGQLTMDIIGSQN